MLALCPRTGKSLGASLEVPGHLHGTTSALLAVEFGTAEKYRLVLIQIVRGIHEPVFVDVVHTN